MQMIHGILPQQHFGVNNIAPFRNLFSLFRFILGALMWEFKH